MTAFRAYVGDVPSIDALLRALRDAGGEGKVQLLDGARVAGRDHLEAARLHAERALARGTALAKDPGLETLRRAAGERQIGRALDTMGVKPGPGRLVAAVVLAPGGAEALDALAERLGWSRADASLEAEAREGGLEALLDLWGVGAEERRAVPVERRKDLVLERVALADVGVRRE